MLGWPRAAEARRGPIIAATFGIWRRRSHVTTLYENPVAGLTASKRRALRASCEAMVSALPQQRDQKTTKVGRPAISDCKLVGFPSAFVRVTGSGNGRRSATWRIRERSSITASFTALAQSSSLWIANRARAAGRRWVRRLSSRPCDAHPLELQLPLLIHIGD